MAKKAKETGLPVLIALVMFVLLSVGLGVFCYVLYSDQAGKDQAVEKAKKDEKDLRALVKIAENKARLYRVAIGIDEAEEKATLVAESKAGDDYVQELKKLNEAVEKRLAAVSAGIAEKDKVKFPPVTAKDLIAWAPDVENKLPAAPTKVILDGAVKAYADREVVRVDTDNKAKDYEAALAILKDKTARYDAATVTLGKAATDLAETLKVTLAELKKASDDRQATLVNSNKGIRDKNDAAETAIIRLTAEKDQVAKLVDGLKTEMQGLQERQKQADKFNYDEPVCKILRRNADNTVEIDLGSTDKARAGLSFSVLPADFPTKGYQSRVKTFREADERGRFRDVPRFVEKATVEVLDVLGPSLAKARITTENDSIRDRVLPGDLLYSAAWHRGHVEHIALFGIFDTNGDGTDDIKNVVRDFAKMGIPVDAYFDLQAKKWVGEFSQRTRYTVEGFYPTSSASDPLKGGKTELITALGEARKEAEGKGSRVVSFRDFFPRVGYKVRPDVTEDKINQAASRYLQGQIGATDAPPPAPAPNN